MKRPSQGNRKLVALALLAGVGGACSNAVDEDASDITGQEQYVQQIQAELDAASAAEPSTAKNVSSVRPVLKCVEKLANNQYRAHFGYSNSASSPVSIPVGFFNRFWPPPIGRGQPIIFAPGSMADVVQVPFSSFSASIWVLGTHFSVATKFSRLCAAGGTGGQGVGGMGIGGSGTGGSGTGGRGTGGNGTGGVIVGTGGSGTGGMGTGGVGTGGTIVGTGGSGTGGMGTGGVGTGGTIVGTGGSGTGGMGTGGVGTGGTIVGTGGSGTGGSCGLSNCDDQNPCTIDTIDREVCVCVHMAALDTTVCNDGDACTVNDHCAAGACVGGGQKTCTALDVCHVAGICTDHATGACSNPSAANGTTCSDGNACTQNDICTDGVCTMGAPVLCNAPDVCHTPGTCNQTTGQCQGGTNAPNGTACNDNDACTPTDSCQGGVCTGGNRKTCPATDVCHIAGACDPANGTCSNPVAQPGTPCSDNNACTDNDVCQAGACVPGSAHVCLPPTDSCLAAGVCNPAVGTCSYAPKADGASCDNGANCSTGDVCRAGICVDRDPSHCIGPVCDACTDLNCYPGTDGCDSIVNLVDRKLCEDLYACLVAPTHPGTSIPGPCIFGGDPTSCWCGTNGATCTTSNTAPTQANGPCVQQVFAAAKTTDAATIYANFINANTPDGCTFGDPLCLGLPWGRANNLASCRSNYCSAECSVNF